MSENPPVAGVSSSAAGAPTGPSSPAAAAGPALSTVPANDTTLSRYPPQIAPPLGTGPSGVPGLGGGFASAPPAGPSSSASQTTASGGQTASGASPSSGSGQAGAITVPKTPSSGINDVWLLTGLIVLFTAAVGGVVLLGGYRSARRKY